MNGTKKMRALSVKEDFNMYGGAHVTNYDEAKKAMEQGRDLIVHCRDYDGQRYHYCKYRVTNLRMEQDGAIVGDNDDGERWEATRELCNFALTGRI